MQIDIHNELEINKLESYKICILTETDHDNGSLLDDI